MSILDDPRSTGAEVTGEDVRAAIDAEMREFCPDEIPTDRENLRAFMHGALSQTVATFLNNHPEMRGEMLPSLERDTTTGGW